MLTDPASSPACKTESWHESLARSIRSAAVLWERLQLPAELLPAAEQAAKLFSVLVPESYLAKMQPGNVNDPLLRQVIPVGDECETVLGFVADPVQDGEAKQVPGLLQKYSGRALLITTGSCAVHCRYCFRRHYPYQNEPHRLADWEPALDHIRQDDSLSEIILSGGDPLMLTDARLQSLCESLNEIQHLQRLRIHTRLPIVLPNRVTEAFLKLLTRGRLTPIVVVHANHPAEVIGDTAAALRSLVCGGVTVLNQAVLLRGINDAIETQHVLCERLVNLGVMPYYLHQLDRVAGAAHFEVSEERGQQIIAALRTKLPGYAVPQFVKEIPGEFSKSPYPERPTNSTQIES